MSFRGFAPYVPVAQRRANAAKEVEKLKKKGRAVAPVVIEGRKIAASFWGKAWCDNLERYSDYANRLPRGRTYVNNGSVVDLQLTLGKVEALVSGSEIYKVKIDIAVSAPARWKAICADCAGSVGSIVELLQGKLSKHVMERVCRQADGLFPAPKEIRMSCSCPDSAGMCKHIAATLYGVGARLDHDPDLLFRLRGVNRSELVSTGADLSITEAAAGSERVLAGDDVAALFGLAFDTAPPAEKPAPTAKPAKTASLPSSAAKRREKIAGGETKPRAAQKSASKVDRAASPAKANSVVESRRAPAAKAGLGKSVSGVSVAPTESTPAPKAARKSERTPSTSAEANPKATFDRARPAPAAQAEQKPGLGAKAAEKPREGRTRAAKWIGAKALKEARK